MVDTLLAVEERGGTTCYVVLNAVECMLVGIALALFWDLINTVQELFRQVYCDEKDLKRDVYTQEFNSVEYHGSHLHLSCFSCHPNLYCHDS